MAIKGLDKNLLRQLTKDSERIATELGEFSATAQVLSDGEQNLIKKHPSRWVGIYKSEVAGVAKNINKLMEQLAEKRIPASQTIIRFIDKNQRTLIL